jgi:hypothetical protein
MKDDPLNRIKVRRGSQLPWAKLTEADARYVLQCAAKRTLLRSQAALMSNTVLAQELGVSRRTIDKITEGHTWLHVDA